jgi:hypothetical protein
MSDDDRRPTRSGLIQRILDNPLRLRVERAGGLVEEQNGRVGDDRARDGDALLLAAGEQEPALADGRVVALGERSDEGVRVGLGARGVDGGEALVVALMFEGSAGESELDIGANGHGEEDGLL